MARDLDEQINSVKRELDNLYELGVLRFRTELKKKIFYVNSQFVLLDEFIDIFLKTYNPIEPIKEFFKPRKGLELIIVNESVRYKLLGETK